MRTVLVLAALVALAVAGPAQTFLRDISSRKFEKVKAATVERQYKVLELFETINQVNVNATYYKIGKDFDIKANIHKYQKPKVITKFFALFEKDFLPKYNLFTIFNDKMRQQAKALYDVFYNARDFDTFYKTAAWARVHVNKGMFAYTFYVALVQRSDTKDLVLPPFYELAPESYVTLETFNKIFYGRMRGEPFEQYPEYGIIKEGDYHIYYQNYSDYYTYGDEFKLAYLTEDIGWNSFYTYLHVMIPFWEEGDNIVHGIFKERGGEIYFHFYQQLLARYYLERLSNGMGEIPTFSWNEPFKYGFRPFLTTKILPFVQRTDNYIMQNKYNLDDLRYVRNYENMFLSFLEQGQFTAFNKEVDFSNSKTINWVGNFWEANPDLYEEISDCRNYFNSYERAARRILGGASISYKHGDYEFIPTALDFYQTSLRDPAFYQLYNKIWRFMSQYKQYLPPYSQESLHYVGVEVNKVEVTKLETFFDFHLVNVSNGITYTNQELTSGTNDQYAIRQPRLNHAAFQVKISVRSEVEEEATFKVFIGPQYDSLGTEIKFEDNYMNFVEVDVFSQELTTGENVIERNSTDFFFYKEDSLSVGEIYNLLEEDKLPVDMLYKYDNLPNRLMLPRGTKSGFPLQIFVAVYKSQGISKEAQNEHTFFFDERPLGYPLDRQVTENFFQPNMYLESVVVYHIGNEYPTSYETVAEHLQTITQ